MGFFSRKKERVAPSAPQVTQQSLLTPGQQNVLTGVTGATTDILAGGGRAEAFPGDLGPSSLQSTAFGSIEDLFQGDGQAQDFIDRGFTPFSEEATIDQFNRFQRPLAQSNRAESERLLLNQLSGAGGFDSAATARALARAGSEFDLGLQSQLGSQINIDRSRSDILNQQALNNLLGIQTQGLQGGQVQQGITDREREEFVRSQQIDPLLQQLLPSALGTRSFENIVQAPQTVFQPSGAETTSSIFGGLGSLATGISGFFNK